MFSVHAQVKYKKSVWGVVKGFIEKNTWAGLEDFYTALLRALQSEYCIPPAKAKGRRPRRGIALYFLFHYLRIQLIPSRYSFTTTATRRT